MQIIRKLREPKIQIANMDLAIFDLSATVLAGYWVARRQNWNIPLTITGTFLLGHIAHNLGGVQTPLSRHINETFARRPEDGVTTLPIHNSGDPVGLQETRYPTIREISLKRTFL